MKRFTSQVCPRHLLSLISLASILTFLSACTAPQDSLVGTRLVQPVEPRVLPAEQETTDIVIVGEQVANQISQLPEVTSAAKPPVIKYNGVTSILTGPETVDTELYTNLLRDRLLTKADNKVRYMERILPLRTKAKREKKRNRGKKLEDISREEAETTFTPDFELTAELQGPSQDTSYRLQIQLIQRSTQSVIFNDLYRIHKEIPSLDAPGASPLPPSGDGSGGLVPQGAFGQPGTNPSYNGTTAPPSPPGSE